MPFQGNGQYVLPSQFNPVITDTIILSAWANTTFGDVAQALTNCITRDGQSAPSTNLPMSGFRHTNVGPAQTVLEYVRADQEQGSILHTLTGMGGGPLVYTGSLPFGQTNFSQGQIVVGSWAAANGAGAVTLSINGSTPVAILRSNGAPLAVGDIQANTVTQLVFVNGSWRLLTGLGAAGLPPLDTSYVRIDGTTPMTGLLTLSGAPTAAGHAATKAYVDVNKGGRVDTVSSATPNQLAVSVGDPVNIGLAIIGNVANGVAVLDGSGKVPTSLLPVVAVTYLGLWNASSGVLPAAAAQGSYYIINPGGTLTLYKAVGTTGNYTPQSVATVAGDRIVYNATAIGTSQPIGWYWMPKDSAPVAGVLAQDVTVTPTPTFPSAINQQQWDIAADSALLTKVPLAGGTMTGPLVLAADPVADPQAASKHYVDARIAASAGVVTFNGRAGAVALTSADVTGALFYTPANAAGQAFTGNISAPQVTSSGLVVGKMFNPALQTNGSASGNIPIDASLGHMQLVLAGNVNIGVRNLVPGGVLRIYIFQTQNGTITFDPSISDAGAPFWWEGPDYAPPNFNAGPNHLAIVAVTFFPSAYQMNVSTY